MNEKSPSTSREAQSLLSSSVKDSRITDGCRTPEFKSYKQFINNYSPFAPRLSLVQKFFANEPHTSNTPTITTVIDFTNESCVENGPFTTATAEFSEVLTSRSVEVETRLILVAYRHVQDADRSLFDCLGLHFDIDPDFLRRHLYSFKATIELGKDSKEFYGPGEEDKSLAFTFLLPSEDRSTYHFSFTRSSDIMSAYVHEDRTTRSKTVLLFMRYYVRIEGSSYDAFVDDGRRISVYKSVSDADEANDSLYVHAHKNLRMRYLASLLQMTKKDIFEGNIDTPAFFYPYVRDLVFIYFDRYRALYNTETPSYFSKSWQRNRNRAMVYDGAPLRLHDLDQIKVDMASLRNLQEVVERLCTMLQTPETRERYGRLLKDMSLILRKYKASAEQCREARTNEVMEAQIKEARASAQQAISITRLSKLAFVFIPLSFTSSLFGMNVVEMGQGTVPLRYFIIMALAVSICSLLPMLPSIVRSFRGSNFSRDVYYFWEHLKTLVRLAFYSREVAYYYATLRFRFEHPIFMYLCGQRVQDAIMKKRGIGHEDIPSKDLVQLKVSETDKAEFWIQKAQMVLDFCDDHQGLPRSDALRTLNVTTW